MAEVKIAPAARQQINENLKRVYQLVLEEDLPDRFKALLAGLREAESKS